MGDPPSRHPASSGTVIRLIHAARLRGCRTDLWRNSVRYVLAIVALALSGVFLLLGIGQRTFLAGPSEIVYSVGTEETASYAVLDVSELEKVDGQANIVMRGETAFSALANTRDADAWLEPFDHVELTIDPATKSVVRTPVKGKAPATDLLEVDEEGATVRMDPRGSDLWLEEHVGSDAGTRMAVEAVGEQSIVIAGADAGPIPKGTAIVWVQDRATPWAGPLLAAGGLFAALGAVLYLIAFDRDKRALGPRRGRRGPLLGVRNVFGVSKKRGGDTADSAPKRGSLDNTAAAGALGAGAAGTVDAADGSADAAAGTPGPARDAEEIVTAEVVDEDSGEALAADEVVDEVEVVDEDEDAVVDEVIVDAEIADVEVAEAEVTEVEVDVEVSEVAADAAAEVEVDADNEVEVDADTEDVADADAHVDADAVSDADAETTDPATGETDAETDAEGEAEATELDDSAAKKGDDHAE